MSNAIFLNDNGDGNLHHGEIYTAEKPMCAGKGLWCPALYRSTQLVPLFTTFANFMLISLMIYLSIAKVKDGLFKYFTLNLMATCTLITIADLMVDVINVISFFANADENLYRIRRWARRCLSFGNIWFHALALYAAIVCYLAY
uniref:G_PROTEIN_RECEP_F1_2 domain-containing protein n=1 Tax=Elaeophora elaphi TaxID=1147741 RepID=A0A0R3RNZ8_9BILA